MARRKTAKSSRRRIRRKVTHSLTNPIKAIWMAKLF